LNPSAINTYFRQTRGPVYSYVFALPLVFLYELLIRISQPGQDQIVRIAVDVWFRMLFTYAGLDALTAIFVITAAVGGVIIYSKRKTLPTLKGRYFFWMLAECLLYALLFAILISQFLDLLLNMNSQESLNQLTKLQLFALSLGAGLYEELFFRVILVSGLFFLINLISDKTALSYTASVVLAALLFSGVHYVGNFADSWAIEGFLFRFLFGLTLNVIYVIRGFGCAAWTHAIYDLIIVFRL